MLYSASLSPHSPLSSLLCHLPWEPARMVPETAPPALAIAVEAVILQTREATSVPVPDNAIGSSRSSKHNPILLTELEFCWGDWGPSGGFPPANLETLETPGWIEHLVRVDGNSARSCICLIDRGLRNHFSHCKWFAQGERLRGKDMHVQLLTNASSLPSCSNTWSSSHLLCSLQGQLKPWVPSS